MGPPEVAAPPADTPLADVATRLTWLAAVPTALVVLLIGVALYPDAVTDPDRISRNRRFFDGIVLAPEPGDRFRYALGVFGALLLAALVIGALRWPRARRVASTPGALVVVVAVQVGAAAFAAWCLTEQEASVPYFGRTDVVVMAVVAVVAVAVWRRRDRLRLPGSATVQAAAGYGVSALVSGSYVLTTVVTDGGIGRSLGDVRFHLPFTMGDFTSFANGRTPLVDFVPQYTNVLPYVVGPPVGIFDGRISVFSAAMGALTAAALVGVFLVLRSVTKTAAGAAALFLPFVGLTFLKSASVGPDYANIGLYYAVLPMRYVGPWVAVAACLPYLRRPSPRTLALAAGVAGVVALNNLDWGIPALGAVGACLWCGDATVRERAGRNAVRIGGALAVGAAAAVVVLTLVTLVRAGELPDLGLALEFPRLFAVNGYFLIPAPGIGPYLALYLTFVAAGALALGSSLVGGDRDRRRRVSDGALAFGAVFGLGAGAYYMGRSHPGTLYALFSAWAFVIVLLAHRAAQLAGRSRDRLPALWVVPSLAVLLLYGLAAATVREVPAPWRQLDRLTTGGAATFDVDPLVPFVREHTRPGEEVAILTEQSHRLALASGVRDVTPFNSVYSIISFAQLDLLMEQIDEADVRTVFAGDLPFVEVEEALTDAGFRIRETDPETGLTWWRRSST